MSQQNKSKIFITGGGTGGHIYPAVAVAEALKDDFEICYVGNPRNLEKEIVQQKGYKFLSVCVQGLPRKATLDLVKCGINLGISVLKSFFYIIKYRPKAVFGTGGYVSAPALIAAKFLNVPFVMHDCDANPGLVTRKLAPFASSVSIAFECAKAVIKNKNCFLNGNPLREEFKTLSKDDARKALGLENRLTVAFMGGSQGAKSINSTACEILKTLSKDYGVQIIFQTGKKKYEDVIEKLATFYPEYESDKNIIVRPYFEDMVSVMKASDIAVSRAGSLSISELAASGVATVYVPYPFAAADHQRKNARFMQENNAGFYLEDAEVSASTLLSMLVELISDSDRLSKVQQATMNLAKYDGASSIVSQIKQVI